MTKTLIDINDELLERASRALGTASKKDTVNAALEAVALHDQVRRAAALQTLRANAEQWFDFDFFEKQEEYERELRAHRAGDNSGNVA